MVREQKGYPYLERGNRPLYAFTIPWKLAALICRLISMMCYSIVHTYSVPSVDTNRPTETYHPPPGVPPAWFRIADCTQTPLSELKTWRERKMDAVVRNYSRSRYPAPTLFFFLLCSFSTSSSYGRRVALQISRC